MKVQRPLDFWLRLVDDLLSKSFGSALEEHGLTRRQWATVNLLSAGPARRADLDAVLAPFLPPPELASSSAEELSELVDSGWLSDRDGTYTLTERGRLVHGRLEAAWQRRNDELLRGISTDEVSHLIGLLERLAGNLGWSGDSGPDATFDEELEQNRHAYQVEMVETSAQRAAVVRGTARSEEISAFLGAAFSEVLAVLEHQGAPPAGPPFARYVPGPTGTFDVVAGFPCLGLINPSGRVQPDELPGGSIARTLHHGGYAGVGEAYDALDTWIVRRGYVATGPAWESYLDGPDVPEPRTLVQLPCRVAEPRTTVTEIGDRRS